MMLLLAPAKMRRQVVLTGVMKKMAELVSHRGPARQCSREIPCRGIEEDQRNRSRFPETRRFEIPVRELDPYKVYSEDSEQGLEVDDRSGRPPTGLASRVAQSVALPPRLGAMSQRFRSSQRLDRGFSTQESPELAADSAQLRSQGEGTPIRRCELSPFGGPESRHTPAWVLLLPARKRSEIDRQCFADPPQLERSNRSASFDLAPTLFRQSGPAGSIGNRRAEGFSPLFDLLL